MENKINAKITNGQYDKRNQNSRTKQMDKLLKEQYTAETKILETALLKAAGKSSWDEFPTESEEEIQEGYNRLITRLKENGEYREKSFTPDMTNSVRSIDSWSLSRTFFPDFPETEK